MLWSIYLFGQQLQSALVPCVKLPVRQLILLRVPPVHDWVPQRAIGPRLQLSFTSNSTVNVHVEFTIPLLIEILLLHHRFSHTSLHRRRVSPLHERVVTLIFHLLIPPLRRPDPKYAVVQTSRNLLWITLLPGTSCSDNVSWHAQT